MQFFLLDMYNVNPELTRLENQGGIGDGYGPLFEVKKDPSRQSRQLEDESKNGYESLFEVKEKKQDKGDECGYIPLIQNLESNDKKEQTNSSLVNTGQEEPESAYYAFKGPTITDSLGYETFYTNETNASKPTKKLQKHVICEKELAKLNDLMGQGDADILEWCNDVNLEDLATPGVGIAERLLKEWGSFGIRISDWNERFLFVRKMSGESRHKELVRLASDFTYVATMFGQIILSELCKYMLFCLLFYFSVWEVAILFLFCV